MSAGKRIAEELNEALHAAFAADPGAFLLGEDIADPYGGAFRVTKGLSTAYPDRVLSTPISEGAMLGVAGGLALSGHRVIVEVMFGDFLALGFDQVLNFATKSVSMYGTRTPMPLVVRAPVGGGRGYGPTHSQSLQKHFIGIPHLALYELSPLHDPAETLTAVLARDEPSILFEDKILYTQRRYRDGRVDDRLTFGHLDAERCWAHVRASTPGRNGRVVLIATGGVAHRAVAAAHQLLVEDGLDVHVLVPSLLYPADLAAVLPLLDDADSVWVAEESTAGGTWGAEVAAGLHRDAWHSLKQPVRLLHSADRIIPAAPHLERRMLLQAETIRDAIRAEARQTPRQPRPRPTATVPTPAEAVPSAEVAQVTPSSPAVRVPKLNNNDDTYVLTEWLVEDGDPVLADTAVAVVETSKAAEELVAGVDGKLRIRVPAGDNCAPGDVIALVSAPTDHRGEPEAPGVAAPDEVTIHPLSDSQLRGLAAATASHHEIPPAFSLVRVEVVAASATALTELAVQALGELRAEFPLLYSTRLADGRVRIAAGAHVAVTVDLPVGTALPVVRDAHRRTLSEIRDDLAALRLASHRGELGEGDDQGANIALSLHREPEVVFVQPVIPPGMIGIVSIGGDLTDVRLDEHGNAVERTTAGVGLTYDHRVVNGQLANGFLSRLKALLEHPA
ncbi:2-oxo acid dehydrogenase subunit E2 [Plantactinospora sp. CA-290183]|uniref:2-oxo acid dehydrogenase subunit E2 n=1 Tax=Plantactinospora sp. CA-290183 TaxID=3240006 RepID=UPI003D900B36